MKYVLIRKFCPIVICDEGDELVAVLVGNPEDRFSRDEAHIIVFIEIWKIVKYPVPLSHLPQIHGRSCSE